MDNNIGGVSPVGIVPAATPVNQRRPRQQQEDKENNSSEQEKPESEERQQEKPGKGLDCYA